MSCSPANCDSRKVKQDGSGVNLDCESAAASQDACKTFLYCVSTSTNPNSLCQESTPTPIPPKDTSEESHAVYFIIAAIVIVLALILYFYMKKPSGAALNPALLKVLTQESSS